MHVISPNFVEWKFCEKAHANCTFPQNFHTRKLGKITAFYAWLVGNLLAVEQKNYLNKIVNIYIAYDLDVSPRNLTKNFRFKNCLFGATPQVKNSDKENYVHSEYGITFDNAG